MLLGVGRRHALGAARGRQAAVRDTALIRRQFQLDFSIEPSEEGVKL